PPGAGNGHGPGGVSSGMASRLPTDTFPAMGSTCEVALVGGDEALLARARNRVEYLESRWSRFREDSEVSRLNRRPGKAMKLSVDGYLLVDRALEGWRVTQGRYDPSVLRAIEAAGYARSFEKVPPVRPAGCAAQHPPGWL